KGSNETGSEYPFIIILKDDTVYLLLDTTGNIGLHKRGYRIKASKAPIRETIATGVIILSHWNSEIPLFDPFCGSGTIPIEAAILEVPNISRKYVSENWKILKKEWEIIKKNNGKNIKTENKKIYASDVDCQVINIAKENYNRAKKLFNINTNIDFKCTDFRKLPVFNEPAYVISNLPYGQRIEVDILKEIKILREKFPKGKFYLIHPSEDFEKYFGKATKKFKFQNSGIWTYLYMYY
ncbi:MAG TPA: RNA methyltransferase, partial [Fervidobacterium nodosum]|nr:RNA methyltransferase [Fervidobacterium nodosum]